MSLDKPKSLALATLWCGALLGWAGTLLGDDPPMRPQPATTRSTEATKPAPSQAALRDASGLLQFAAEEAAKIPSAQDRFDQLVAIARGQGLVKDLDRLRTTVSLIEKTVDAVDPQFRPYERVMAGLAIAGDFAAAGDEKAYSTLIEKYKDAKEADPRELAAAYADARDYPKMLKAAESLDNGLARNFAYETLALRLAGSDPAEALTLLDRAESHLHDADVHDFDILFVISDYATIGQIERAFALAATDPARTAVPPAPGTKYGDDTFHVYGMLADVFEETGNRAAADRAEKEYVAALAKAPKNVQDMNRYELFRRQVKHGDIPAATATLDQLKAYADGLPEIPRGHIANEKPVSYLTAALAAARLGKEQMASDSLKAASQSGHLRQFQPEEDRINADEAREPRAEWLAAQGKPAEAVALVMGSADPEARSAGSRVLIDAASKSGDLATALAVFDKLDDRQERLMEIPTVARLIARAAPADEKVRSSAPNHGRDAAVTPMGWVKSLTDPAERAVAAQSLAFERLGVPWGRGRN